MMREAAANMKNLDFNGRAKLVSCPHNADDRGILCAFNFDQLPFVPRRVFSVSQVPIGVVRGGHAHRSGEQLLGCLQGCIDVLMRFQGEEITVTLQSGPIGLLVGAGVWCEQKYITAGSVLLVLSSEPYDPASYIYTWT